MAVMKRWIIPAVVCGLVTLVGCGGSVPTTHYYILEPRDLDRSAARTQDAPRVGVTPFQVDAPYDQDRIVYRIGADSPEIKFYAYHRWATPLARMLPQLIAAELDAPGTRVEVADSASRYDAQLSGRLLTLEEVDIPSGQIVRIRLELTLRDQDGQELWSKVLEDEATVNTREVTVIVEQMRSSLTRTVRAASDEIRASL